VETGGLEAVKKNETSALKPVDKTNHIGGSSGNDGSNQSSSLVDPPVVDAVAIGFTKMTKLQQATQLQKIDKFRVGNQVPWTNQDVERQIKDLFAGSSLSYQTIKQYYSNDYTKRMNALKEQQSRGERKKKK
jgi:hypothetical protein